MKNRKVTYLLLVLTLFLWGSVIYRIVSYSGNDTPSLQNPVKETSQQCTDTLDFSLKLDYRDPFLNTDQKQVVVKSSKTTNKVMSNLTLEPPDFKYKGIIRNKKNIYAVIESGGSVETIRRHQRIDGYRILAINADSLIVERNGRKYSLKAN